MKPRVQTLLFLLLPLLSQGLEDDELSRVCNRTLQREYCEAPYGGDMHTACRFCGLGLQCPSTRPSGRGLTDPKIQEEILRRHNAYRDEVRLMQRMQGRARCIPRLR